MVNSINSRGFSEKNEPVKIFESYLTRSPWFCLNSACMHHRSRDKVTNILRLFKTIFFEILAATSIIYLSHNLVRIWTFAFALGLKQARNWKRNWIQLLFVYLNDWFETLSQVVNWTERGLLAKMPPVNRPKQ